MTPTEFRPRFQGQALHLSRRSGWLLTGRRYETAWLHFHLFRAGIRRKRAVAQYRADPMWEGADHR